MPADHSHPPIADPDTGEILQEGESVPQVPGGSRAVVRTRPGAELELRKPVAGVLRPVEEPAQLLEAQEATRAMVAGVLKEGRDYGIVPGTKKKSLLQPGAQRTAMAFGCMAVTEIVESEVDHERTVHWEKKRKIWKDRQFAGWERETGTSVGLYRYIARCRLIHRGTGVQVGEGFGICSSLEDRYVDRPRDLEHTIMRMAKKRALVDAVLQTFSMSEQFQDEEEAKEEREELPYEEQLKIARGRYHALLAELLPNPRIRELARKAYQLAHPQLPDSSTGWEPQHFQRAAAELEKFGPDTFTRAVAWRARQDPAGPVDRELLDGVVASRQLDPEELEFSRWLREAGVSSWIQDELRRLGKAGQDPEPTGAQQGEEAEAWDPDEDPDPHGDGLPF